MTSRINRQQATWPQPSKTEAVINTTSLYRKCVRHSPKTCRERKRGGERGESLFTALSLVKTFFPEVCYYRPSSWVPIQSGACSYKPWGFEGSLDWLGGFHQGISTGSHWITISRPSTANLCWTGLLVEVVVVRTSFLALEYGSVRTQDV